MLKATRQGSLRGYPSQTHASKHEATCVLLLYQLFRTFHKLLVYPLWANPFCVWRVICILLPLLRRPFRLCAVPGLLPPLRISPPSQQRSAWVIICFTVASTLENVGPTSCCCRRWRLCYCRHSSTPATVSSRSRIHSVQSGTNKHISAY